MLLYRFKYDSSIEPILYRGWHTSNKLAPYNVFEWPHQTLHTTGTWWGQQRRSGGHAVFISTCLELHICTMHTFLIGLMAPPTSPAPERWPFGQQREGDREGAYVSSLCSIVICGRSIVSTVLWAPHARLLPVMLFSPQSSIYTYSGECNNCWNDVPSATYK